MCVLEPVMLSILYITGVCLHLLYNPLYLIDRSHYVLCVLTPFIRVSYRCVINYTCYVDSVYNYNACSLKAANDKIFPVACYNESDTRT